MKIIKSLSLLLAALFSIASIYAQTVEEIIAKHIDAIGGKEKLSTITSVRMENTVQVMGSEGPSTTVILNGKGFRSESEFNGQKIVQVYTDKGGWAINPFAGGDDPQAMPDEQYKSGEDQIYVEPLFDYAAKGSKAELVGKEKLGNVEAYKIKLTNKDNASTTYYLDPATFYTLQVETSANVMGQDLVIKTVCSDYKKNDFGFVLPNTLEINIGDQFSMTSKLQKVEINQPVDATIFEMKK